MRFFLLFILWPAFLHAQESSYEEVMRITSRVVQEQRYVGVLDETSVHQLPVGLIKEIGDARYIIAIDSAVFYPDGAFFHAYFAVEFPGTGKHLAFAAKRIPFNSQGVISGSASRLMLVSEHQIPLGPHSNLSLNADGSNYVEWDCEGFSAIQLSGRLEIMNGIFQPELPGKEAVEGSFRLHSNDIHHLLAEASIDPFSLRGLPDWKFNVKKAVMDWSSFENASEMVFPFGYGQQSGMQWTGFYLEEIEVELPEELKGDREDPLRFNARNILIDETGLSGSLHAENILDAATGRIGSWMFSIDEIHLQISENLPVGGGMNGKISMPVMGDESTVRYEGLLMYDQQNKRMDYALSLAPAQNVSFSIFSAKADLYPNSSLSFIRKNGRVEPEAILHGKIAVEHPSFQTARLDFSGLKIHSESPYISGGIFAYTGNQPASAANYPVSIDSIRILSVMGSPVLESKIQLNLMDPSSGGLQASTRVRIISKQEAGRLKFDRLDIGAMGVAMHTQAFSVSGSLQLFKEDPNYGEGFSGQLALKIPDVIDPGFQVFACFGKSSFRYFSMDAFVPANFPIPGTPIGIHKIAGGLSYHMRPQRTSIGQCLSLLQQNGNSSSATQLYIPDSNFGLSFRAGAGVRYLPNESVFNGDVMVEVGFLSTGGLDRIRLTGNAYFMADMEQRKSSPAPVSGTLDMLYAAPLKTFDAQLSVRMNLSSVLTGEARSRVFVSPDTWQVLVGRPSDPAVVSVKNFGSAQAYFMVGKDLEPMASVPGAVAHLVSASSLDQQRNMVELSQGRGLVAGMRFGGGFQREIGWDRFSLYGSFSYLAGFDMMLRDYGRFAYCTGKPAPVGMNGKVAEGNLYAHLKGTIGAKGTISGKEFDLILLSGSVAALLQGKLPDPSWLAGGVSCSYEILSLIQGQFQFQFELGENCTIQQP